METETINRSEKVYAVVNNIPSTYRSADLRRFFSLFVETEGFDCFHFRHRPELQSIKMSAGTESSVSQSLPVATKSQDTGTKTVCCIIRLKEAKFNELMRTYHQRLWLDSRGESLPSKCLISRLKTSLSDGEDSINDGSTITSSATINKYQTRGEKQCIPPVREEFKEEDLLKLPELQPPTVMPHGNVGTPTMQFKALIQECRLPPSIIKKLQLDFSKPKYKGKYGSVPFDYQTKVISTVACDDDNESVTVSKLAGTKSENFKKQRTAKSMNEKQITDTVIQEQITSKSNSESNIQPAKGNANNDGHSKTVEPHRSDQNKKGELDYKEKRRIKKLAKQETKKLMAERIEEKMIEFEKAGSDSNEDNDSCEEWERHEAMYDDVTNQGRNKDRLFEEEMEVVWEKGGSGLVFYTDAQYWQEKEGDFDEQTADDLDVDMSAYYEEGAGDADIRDFLTIRQEQRRRRGIDSTDRFSAGIGKFECHTKGIGRKIMEKQGWTEGSGLGSSVQGISDALDNEGQHPRDRKGLGYRGEKLLSRKYRQSARRKRKAEESEVFISTVYDNPTETDPLEPLNRRHDPSYIKHRNRIN